MTHMPFFAILLAFLCAVCDASTSNAQEETCVESHVKQQLLQARDSLATRTEEEEDETKRASNKRQVACPWLPVPEGLGCHDIENEDGRERYALCKNGKQSWKCIEENFGERQRCPCHLPYMCANKKCGGGKEYCCEKTCEGTFFGVEKFYGGERPCEGKEEVEPTGEPAIAPAEVTEEPTPEPRPIPRPTPSPTPKPKTCYDFTRSFTKILDYAGINVHNKNNDDQRNTCIVYNEQRSSDSVKHFQDMGDWENQGAAAAILTLKANGHSEAWLKGTSADNQRNTLIVLTNKCNSGQSISDLQKKKTLDIAIIMNQGDCCPR